MHPRTFPEGFTLGVSTSAYQIEGAWNADGKGESIWDRFTHERGHVSDDSTGDRACDHYHRLGEDLDLIGGLAVDAYRFSVSWPRILPEGTGRINQAGLDFYERLVDGLLERGVTPFLTLYHWDLPQALEDRGGWTNRDAAGWFADYAHAVASRFGDRVDQWMTLNEPLSVVGAGYLAGVHAPGRRSLIDATKSTHVLLLAHARATDAIRSVDPGAAVGIANSFSPVYAARRQDERVARRISAVLNELFMDPFYLGHYPAWLAPIVRLLNRHIRASDWDLIARPPDFIGVNHYSRYIARRTLLPFIGFRMLRPVRDNVVFTDMDWEVYPPAFGRVLRWIRERYGNPPVVVTENGASFDEPVEELRVHDERRVDYLRRYLGEVSTAIDEGQDIRGYFVWSLLDNFEWAHGYSQRFGIVHVDYETLARMPKDSYYFYRSLCHSRRVDVIGGRESGNRTSGAGVERDQVSPSGFDGVPPSGSESNSASHASRND